jgi:hypothetical protein
MSCEALFQNFAASLTPAMMTKCCRKYRIPLPKDNPCIVDLFHTAHAHSHCDSPFSRHLQRYLNRKHAPSITQFAKLQPEALQATIEPLLLSCQTRVPDTLPGVLWAICSDSREDIRPIEKFLLDKLHWLSHYLLLAQFQGALHLVKPREGMPTAERESLQKELEKLQAERCALQHEVGDLKNANTQLVLDRNQLENKFNGLKHQYEVMEQHRQMNESENMTQSITPRELKKLHYQLAKMSEILQEKEDQIQHLMTVPSSDQRVSETPVGETMGEHQVAQVASEAPSVNLNGKTVALIGGLTKASTHYEQAIHQLGGSCIRHDGKVHQGHKKLTTIIRQADIVFCPVNCVSHGTASSAKKLCRMFDKPCYFLRSSGVSHIREKLREMAHKPNG